MGIKQEGEQGDPMSKGDTKEGILKNSNTGTENTNDKSSSVEQYPISNPSTHGYDYAGENKDIGVILALRTERYSRKVVFLVFIKKLKTMF